jgi:hypothetical protein
MSICKTVELILFLQVLPRFPKTSNLFLVGFSLGGQFALSYAMQHRLVTPPAIQLRVALVDSICHDLRDSTDDVVEFLSSICCHWRCNMDETAKDNGIPTEYCGEPDHRHAVSASLGAVLKWLDRTEVQEPSTWCAVL